jgi:hypothetical protein
VLGAALALLLLPSAPPGNAGEIPRVAIEARPELTMLLREELRRGGRLEPYRPDEEREMLRRRSIESATPCTLEQLPPRCLLRAEVIRGRLSLSLFSIDSGCLAASSAVEYRPTKPQVSVAEATGALFASLTKVVLEKPPAEDPSAVPPSPRMIPETVKKPVFIGPKKIAIRSFESAGVLPLKELTRLSNTARRQKAGKYQLTSDSEDASFVLTGRVTRVSSSEIALELILRDANGIARGSTALRGADAASLEEKLPAAIKFFVETVK